jgi:hypothetical protein
MDTIRRLQVAYFPQNTTSWVKVGHPRVMKSDVLNKLKQNHYIARYPFRRKVDVSCCNVLISLRVSVKHRFILETFAYYQKA